MLACHMTEDLLSSVPTQLALSHPAHVDLFFVFHSSMALTAWQRLLS